MTQVTNRIRFEVLKRDGFRCVYCGASAGDVEIEIDHVQPKCKGGKNDLGNLVSACFNCNRGKSGVPLDKVTKIRPSSEFSRGSNPGLVGKCFVVYGENCAVKYQGVIRSKIDDRHYLIQFFSWIDGFPTTMLLVDIADIRCSMDDQNGPGSWVIYEDDEHLRYWEEMENKRPALRLKVGSK